MLHTTTWNTMGRTQWGLGFPRFLNP
jgi:hypothetical protein